MVLSIKNTFEMIDPETNFLSGLLELHHGLSVEEKLKKISTKVSWAQGWPENKQSFWNAEAFMWNHKIDCDKRELIQKELQSLSLENGKNLDLGCGSYSYFPSVGFDFSEKMLQFNDNCIEKVQGDLEQSLPFTENSFDSITAIFVLNYIRNYGLLLDEIKRILTEKGKFVIVLYSKKLNEWQRQKEVNDFDGEKWKLILDKLFFVEYFEKENLWFFVCEKRKTY